MTTSFVLFRYKINQPYREFIRLVAGQAGIEFEYRKSSIDDDSKDHIVTLPKSEKVDGRNVYYWDIARRLKERKVAKTKNDNKEIESDTIPVSGEWQYTSFIFVEDAEIVAVEDRSPPIGMGAHSAIRRFEKCCQKLGIKFSYADVSNNDDIKRAIRVWNIHEFRFSLRPFNPHPIKRAKDLSESMKKSRVKELQGRIKAEDGGISEEEGGIINTIMDFSDNNYGSISIKGTTNMGHVASIKSETITGNKQKDAERSEKAKALRITMDVPEEKIVSNIARALINWEKEGSNF